jgi:hypothetical protein
MILASATRSASLPCNVWWTSPSQTCKRHCECILTRSANAITPLQSSSASDESYYPRRVGREHSRHPIVVIVINPPKQRQHNIQHGSTKLRLVIFVQGVNAAEDTARSALRGFRGKSGTS